MRVRQRGRHEPAPPKPAEPKPAVDLWNHQEVPLSARRLVELIRPAVRLVWIASPRETIYPRRLEPSPAVGRRLIGPI